jgi:hypothetical protein
MIRLPWLAAKRAGDLDYATGGEPGKDHDVARQNRPGEGSSAFSVACKKRGGLPLGLFAIPSGKSANWGSPPC